MEKEEGGRGEWRTGESGGGQEEGGIIKDSEERRELSTQRKKEGQKGRKGR